MIPHPAFLFLLSCFQAQGTWSRFDHPDPQNAPFVYDQARDCLVLVGQDSLGRNMETWERHGESWYLRDSRSGPPFVRSFTRLVHDSVRSVTLLFGGYAQVGIPLGDTWAWDGRAWRQVATSGPGPRAAYAWALDPFRGRVVLHGGTDSTSPALGDTWEWDGSTWTLVASPPNGPGPRVFSHMAYDPVRGTVILVGGRDANNAFAGETWEWNGSSWRQIPALSITLSAGAMATDWSRRRIVFFHGGSAPGTLEWDGTRWSIRSTMTPVGSGHHAMAYDSRRRRILMGYQAPGPWSRQATLWAWDGVSWQTFEDWPRSRHQARMAHHDADAVTLLFGGTEGSNTLDDAWVSGGNTWRRLDQNPRPSARSGHGMVYDAVRQQIVLFGGYWFLSGPGNNPQYLNDTWVWSGGVWREVFPPQSPAPRSRMAMAHDRSRGITLMVGGNGPPPLVLDETWAWDGSTWTLLGPGVGRYMEFFAMAYDEQRKVTVLFGRRTGGIADIWEWDGSQWILRGNQPVRPLECAMAYDPHLKACVFVGTVLSSSQAEVWTWDGTSMVQIGNHPGVTLEPALAYDKARQHLIAFGGGNLGVPPWEFFGETWIHRNVALDNLAPELLPGGTLSWRLRVADLPGSLFVLGLSEGVEGIPVIPNQPGAPILWPLTNDRLFRMALGFPMLWGTTDARGVATMSLPLPNDPTLGGMGIHASALVFDPTIRPARVTNGTRSFVAR